MKFTRRNMLKGSAALAALFAARGANGVLHTDEIFYSDKSLKPDEWKKGVCRYCGTGCGVEVGIKDGKAIAVKGIKDYPVNKGLVCLKGLTLMNVVHSPERAVTPFLKDGNGKFQKISMDKALDTAAKKLNETIAKHGKDSVALYVGAQIFTEEFYAGNKLFKGVIGTNNVEANARLCMASAVTGFLTTFGLDEPPSGYGDIEKADTFFIIGSNLAENHPIIFARVLKRKAENPNFKLIVADPRFTPTAAHADLWLPFYPNMDVSMVNAMAYILVKENLIDKKFIDTHTQFIENGKAWGPEKKHTFESYVKFLEDYKPEDVAEKVGVPADKIIEAARLFGKSKKTMSLWTMGLNQRTSGTWINNLMYNLHLITGKICTEGNTPLSMTGQPNACGGAREQGMLAHLLPAHRTVKKAHHRAKMEEIWKIPKGSISPKPGLHTVKMFEEVGKKIKLIWIACSNPYQTLPDLDAMIKNAKDCFIIVQDIFPPTSTQDKDKFPHVTAELSNLFIPSAFWIEKGGVFGNTERRSSLTEKMIKPPKGLLSDAEIFIEVAKRMGKGQYFEQYKNHEDLWNEYILSSKGQDLDLSGATYEFLRKEGSAQWPILDSDEGDTKLRYQYPQDKYLKRMVTDGKAILHKDFILEKERIEKIEDEKEKTEAEEILKKKRVIPADNIFFYGQKNEGRAKIFLRPQIDAAELPSKEYPLYLSTGRVVHHWHTGTMTMRSPWLAKMSKKSYVEINAIDANKLDIKNNDMVRVTTKRGFLDLKAKVVELDTKKFINADERISIPRPGMIFAPFFDARLLVNRLTVNAYDKMSKEPEYKIAAAKIEKI